MSIEYHMESIHRRTLLLFVFLACLPFRLAKVYVDATGDVKRVILRIVDNPIRKIGIESPELTKLIETFPKGAETLMTRILHILTDKSKGYLCKF